MKTTLEKITPEPVKVKKLPFPKLVRHKNQPELIVLMLQDRCGTVVSGGFDGCQNASFHNDWDVDSDAYWQDLAPDECVKLSN